MARQDLFLGYGERHLAGDAVYLLCRGFWRIVLIALACIGAALAYNLVNGPAYTAHVRVLVTPFSSDLDSLATAQADHGQTARNQAELLRDPGLIQKLLPRLQALPQAGAGGLADRVWGTLGPAWRERAVQLGLADIADPAQRFAARLSRALHVAAVGDTDVIALDFTWPDRVFAARALNLILAGYQRFVADTAEARQALRAAETASGDAQAELAALDSRLTALEAGSDAATLRRDRQRTEARLAEARSRADGLRLGRELARRRLDSVDQAFRAGGWVDNPDSQDSPAGTPALMKSFVGLLDKRQALLARLAPDSPRVRALDAQISQVRQQNYRAVKALCSARLAALDDQLGRLAAGIADDETRLRALDTHLSDVEVVSRARTAQAGRLAEAHGRLAQARRRLDPAWLEVGSTKVLSDAAVPAEPDWPAPSLLLEAAALCGLALGVAAAVASERMRRTLDRPADIVRHLNVELLARLGTYSS